MHPQQPPQSDPYGRQYRQQQYAPQSHGHEQYGHDQYGHDQYGRQEQYGHQGYGRQDHGYQDHGYQQQYQQDPYREQQSAYAAVPQQRRRPAPPPKRRRVWPWVLLGAVLVPILGIAACSALFVGGVNAVQEQRKGSTVAVGQTFTYKSGVALTVSDVVPYKSSNQFIVTKDEAAYKGLVTVVNGGKTQINAALVSINVTAASQPAERIFEDAPLATQTIAPGQQLKIPFQFKVKKGTTGAVQIAVSADFNEPALFTATMN